MVSVDKAFEIRYKKKGNEVQVLVDFDQLQLYKKKPDEVQLSDVLVDDRIYIDQKKGEIASEDILENIFGDKSDDEMIKEILLFGECQIPTAYLNKLREEKKVQVINYIAENAFNPQTKSKYTYSMIERVVSDMKIGFDPLKDASYQAEALLKEMRKKLPISMEKVIMIIKIPGAYCGKFYGPFRKLGKVTKEFFDSQGNMHIHFEISEGSIDKVGSFIKDNSQGEGEYHILR